MTARGLLDSAGPPAAVLLAIALAMEGAKAANLLPVTVPAPSQIAAVVPGEWGNLVYHGAATLRSALLGYAIAALAAFTCAAVAVSRPGAERPIVSVAVLVDCTPLIAVAPILVIFIGQGPILYVLVAAIAAFFPLLLGTVQGLKSTDANARELLHVLAASRWQRLRMLSLPSALPYLFAAMKVAAPLAILGALIAEWMGAERGLGAMVIYALFSFNAPVVWLTIIAICALSALAYGIIALAESRIVTWAPKGGVRHG